MPGGMSVEVVVVVVVHNVVQHPVVYFDGVVRSL